MILIGRGQIRRQVNRKDFINLKIYHLEVIIIRKTYAPLAQW